MAQDGLKIIGEMKKGKELLPIYCFYGDSCLIGDAVQGIKGRVLSSPFKDMNYNSFDAREGFDVDEAISIANTFPVMSGRRVIVVNGAEALSKSMQEGFLSYIKKPSETTSIVFIAATDKVDRRLAFFSELDKADYLFYFKPPVDAELPSWIKKEVQGYGKKITDDAVCALLETAGSELMDIKQEIEKLALFVGDRDAVEKGDVETAVASARIDTVFDLADSIGEKDLRRGMVSLGKILEQGEQPVKIMGMIARQFRIIWKVKALKKKGTAINKIAQMAGIFPAYLNGYLDQGKNFREERLLEIFKTLHCADIALKSGRLHPDMVMEMLVIELCSENSSSILQQ